MTSIISAKQVQRSSRNLQSTRFAGIAVFTSPIACRYMRITNFVKWARVCRLFRPPSARERSTPTSADHDRAAYRSIIDISASVMRGNERACVSCLLNGRQRLIVDEILRRHSFIHRNQLKPHLHSFIIIIIMMTVIIRGHSSERIPSPRHCALDAKHTPLLSVMFSYLFITMGCGQGTSL